MEAILCKQRLVKSSLNGHSICLMILIVSLSYKYKNEKRASQMESLSHSEIDGILK